jgi:Na+-driven multidrug efflux pump
VLTIAVAGPLIAQILLADEYRAGALAVMIWVSGAYAIYSVTQVLECRVLSYGRSAMLLLPMILGAISNLALSFWWISRHGIVGAAQATFASFLVQGVATMAIVLRSRRLIAPL